MKVTITEKGSIFAALTVPMVLSAGGLAVTASTISREESRGAEGHMSFVSRAEVDPIRSLAPLLERTDAHLAVLADGIGKLGLRVAGSGEQLTSAEEMLNQLRKGREAIEESNAAIYQETFDYAVRIAMTKATEEVISEVYDDLAARRYPERPLTAAELEARIYLRTMFELYDFTDVPRSLFVAALPVSLALGEEARTAYITEMLTVSDGEIALSADVNTIAERTVDALVASLKDAGTTPTGDLLSSEVQRVIQSACTVAQTAINDELARLVAEAPTMDKLPMPQYPHGPQPTPEFPDDWAKDALKKAAQKKAIDWVVKKGIEKLTGVKPSLPLGLLLPASPLNEGEDELLEDMRAREEAEAAAKEMWEACREAQRREESGEGGYCDDYSSILDGEWGGDGPTCGGDSGSDSSGGAEGGSCGEGRDERDNGGSCGGDDDAGSGGDGGYCDDASSIFD